MAADKSGKRKRRASKAKEDSGSALRMRSDPRRERRYEPKSSTSAILTMLGTSLGALALGAGVYGEWLRAGDLEPYAYAKYLLAGGGGLVAALSLFGQWPPRPLRVGDAGVAVEKSASEIERIAWRDVTRLHLSSTALTIQAAGTSIAIPLGVHGAAAARALAEARTRIPARIEGIRDDALPPPNDDAGILITLDPPQVAGLRCKATDKLIAFEEDARLCGRCGEVYHRTGVPKRCATCDAPLA